MVEIFGLKLFGCSKCKKTRSQSRKRRRSYKGGYTYKNSGNDAGEDVSNSPMVASRKRSRSRRNMDNSVNSNSNSNSDMGKGKRSKRRRMY